MQVVSGDSGMGELFVLSALDRESVPSYDLAVTATDGSQVATTVVHIDVLDANGTEHDADATRGKGARKVMRVGD